MTHQADTGYRAEDFYFLTDRNALSSRNRTQTVRMCTVFKCGYCCNTL